MARRPGVSWLVCFLFFSTVASSGAGQQLANQPRETFRTAETVHGQAPLNKTTSAGLRRAQMLEMFARGYFPGRTGQLMIVPREGDILTRTDPNVAYMHGSPWPYDTGIPMMFAGPGVVPGVFAVPATQQDVAVTLAGVLGVTLPPRGVRSPV